MYNNEEIIKRLRYIISEMRLTQNEFSRQVGIDSSNLSKYLNGKLAINESLINRLVINLGLSKRWLETGDDLPYAKSQPALPSQTLVSSRISSEPSSMANPGVPVYDIDVTAGVMPRAMMFADENIIGYIDLPNMSQRCRIVKVSGDSMEPVINNGDYIAVREVTDTSILYWGQIYVVLLDDYRMVKYLRKHPDSGQIVLRSANPSYDDIELPRQAIRKLFFVNNIIHIDTRM